MNSREEQIVAVLHDVVEDSPWTIEGLLAEGFSQEIVEAGEVLTKRPGESHAEAAKRAVRNTIARAIKLADNAENVDLTRIANPIEKDYARLKEYKRVRAILLGEQGG